MELDYKLVSLYITEVSYFRLFQAPKNNKQGKNEFFDCKATNWKNKQNKIRRDLMA